MYADLFTAFRAAIVAAWPEVAANGIYHEAELQQISFWRKQEDGDLPFAAMGYSLAPTEEYGADTGAEEGEVRVYYLAPDLDSLGMDALAGKLEALRTQVWRTAPLTCGQVRGYPKIDFSGSLWVNALSAQLQRSFIGGMVSIRILASE